MTPIDVLRKFKTFTEREVADHIYMLKEVVLSGDVMETTPDTPELVHPKVEIGSIAHKNFQPLDFTVPMILWTFDDVSDEGNDTDGRVINIRANIGAYSSDLYSDDRLPDNKAFIDLANVLERLYLELSRRMNVNGVGIIKPIQYGIYDGNYYPYCYGWLTVTARIETVSLEYDEEFFNC